MSRRAVIDQVLTDEYAADRVSRTVLDRLADELDANWDGYTAVEAGGGRTVADQAMRLIWGRLVSMSKAVDAAAAIVAALEVAPEAYLRDRKFDEFSATVGEEFWTVDVLKASDDDFISGALVSATHRKRIFDTIAAHLAGEAALAKPMTLAMAIAA
ncbi:hypothetical protein [Agromyces humi]|uniref:hypothetical protein n=1 Tax=Agromyces humi TaxID=1766800 RepID=UPI0013588665|nr:hypothetical protein [Agromyces humi]